MPILALPFPAIDPVLIELGPFAIRWYALAYIAGLLLGWRYMRGLVSRDELWGRTPRPSLLDVDDFVVYATIGTILGGRLGYVLFYAPAYYLQNPMDILQVWTGGMSFHGGFLGVVLAMVVFAWRRGIPLWTLVRPCRRRRAHRPVLRTPCQLHQWRTVGPGDRCALGLRLPGCRS